MTGAVSNPHYCSGFIRSLVNNQAIFFFPFFFPSLRLVLAEGEAGGGVNNLTHGQFFLKLSENISQRLFSFIGM